MDRKIWDVDKLIVTSQVVLGILIGFLHAIPRLTWLLLIVMALDAFFGLLVYIKNGEAPSPTAARAYATYQVGCLGLVGLGAAFNAFWPVPGYDWVQVFSVAFIPPNVYGIFKNAAILELPLPAQLTKFLEVFKGNENKSTT